MADNIPRMDLNRRAPKQTMRIDQGRVENGGGEGKGIYALRPVR